MEYQNRHLRVPLIRRDRKYFDSADWVTSNEIFPVYPNLFNTSPSTHKSNKAITSNLRECTETKFDEHEKGKSSKYGSLVRNESSCEQILQKKNKGRKFFDSADWILTGASEMPNPALFAKLE